jgi:hypothetical protein
MPLTLHYLEAEISTEWAQFYINELEQILTGVDPILSTS